MSRANGCVGIVAGRFLGWLCHGGKEGLFASWGNILCWDCMAGLGWLRLWRRGKEFIRESDKILRLCAWQVKDEHRAEAKQAYSFVEFRGLGF